MPGMHKWYAIPSLAWPDTCAQIATAEKGLATRGYVISSSPSAQRSWLEFVKEYALPVTVPLRFPRYACMPMKSSVLAHPWYGIDPLYCTRQGMRVVHTDCGIMTYFDPFSFLSSLTHFTE